MLDLARPMFALYIGGMGAKGKNFYNDLACQYGFEEEAAQIQDLYLGGNKRDAEAVVPLELLEMCNLVGPESYVKERIAAFRGGRRHQPPGHARAGRRGPGRPRLASSRSGSPDEPARDAPRRDEHEDFRRTVADLHRARRSSRTTSSGRRTARSAARCGPRPATQGLLCFDVAEEYGGPGVADFRYNVVLAEEHDPGRRAAGPASRCTPTSSCPYLSSLGHRRAEAALAARLRQRRDHHRDRDDRARRGQRPAGHPHDRRRQGRPLRAQRLQDVHQQRHPWPTW